MVWVTLGCVFAVIVLGVRLSTITKREDGYADALRDVTEQLHLASTSENERAFERVRSILIRLRRELSEGKR
jgi:hypothetical protein